MYCINGLVSSLNQAAAAVPAFGHVRHVFHVMYTTIDFVAVRMRVSNAY
jgi:hypothetical protein